MNRERLTITLRKDLLKMVDAAIDGEKIRNRSHAIEVLLSQCLIPNKTKVLILAGGKGIKFRPFTYELPKALIPVRGRPLLEHTIDRLKQNGLTDLTISIGHLGQKIKDHFGGGEKFGVRITYLEQGKCLPGTAQPVKQAESVMGNNPFLLIYGDVLTDINYNDLLEFHRSQRNTLVTMALTSVEHVGMWGVARLVGNRIIHLEEKPNKPTTKSHLVNAGVYAVEPQIFKLIEEKDERLEKEVFPRLAEEGKLSGYSFEGDWYDVSTPEIYEQIVK